MADQGLDREVWIAGCSGEEVSESSARVADRADETEAGFWDDAEDAIRKRSVAEDTGPEALEFVSEEDESLAESAHEQDESLQFLHPLVRSLTVEAEEGELAPGEFGRRRVIGPDGRSPVSAVHLFPFRSVCSLQIYKGSRDQVGTGFLVGKNLVVTAGHNLCNNRNLGDGYVDSIVVYVGRNGRRKFLDSETVRERSRLKVSRAWRNAKDPQLDWGVILLGQDFGTKYGAFALGAWAPSELEASLFNVVGYPASSTTKTRIPYQMWADAGEVTRVEERTLRYTMDTSGGQSGAPLIAWESPRSFVVGVHNYGYSDYNQATRVTADIARAVRQVRGAHFFEES